MTGRDLADCKRRLTHVEPSGGLLLPETRQAQAGADCRKHELITCVVDVTLTPGGVVGALRRPEVEGGRVQGLEQARRLG